MKLIIFLITFTFCDLKAADSLKSHVHGALQMGIAVEKNEVEVTIDGPSESLLGFEHSPRNEKEKKIYAKAESLWKNNLASFVVFESQLQCKITESNFKQHLDGNHSEIEASAKFQCIKEISPSTVTVSLKKAFKHIKKLSVDVVSDKTQRIEITAESKSIKL